MREDGIMKISSLIAAEPFQRRLREGRGKAPVMMVYRGSAEGHSVDDGEAGRAVAGIERCIDEVRDAVGLEITSATVYCSADRSTMTLRFGFDEIEGELAVYHDTTTGETRFQLIHADRIVVDLGSDSDLMALQGDPMNVLDGHFASEGADDIAKALHRLNLVPKVPVVARQEIYTLDLVEIQ